MLRIKRSVAASFSQLHFNTAIIDSATGPSSSGAACSSAHSGLLRLQEPHAMRMLKLAKPALALPPSRLTGSPAEEVQWHCHAGSKTVIAQSLTEPVLTNKTWPRGGAGTVEAGVGKRKRDDMADLEAQLPEVL